MTRWSDEGWIDVSRPLTPETPVWSDDRALNLTHRSYGGLLVSAIATSLHVGTHIDAPLHLDPAGAAVEEISLDRMIGPTEVIRLAVGCRAATPADLPAGWTPRFSRVLMRTDSHPVDAPIEEGFSAVSKELVHWLADHRVLTLGIDTPSVDVFSSEDLEAHFALAERGMTWIEGLSLDSVDAGAYLLMALPLPLHGVEAAPVRALVKPLKDTRD